MPEQKRVSNKQLQDRLDDACERIKQLEAKLAQPSSCGSDKIERIEAGLKKVLRHVLGNDMI